MTKQEIKDDLQMIKYHASVQAKNEAYHSEEPLDYAAGRNSAYLDMIERIEALITKI